eukprot:12809423-Prorocentrum_lima.AAC.1
MLELCKRAPAHTHSPLDWLPFVTATAGNGNDVDWKEIVELRELNWLRRHNGLRRRYKVLKGQQKGWERR